MENREQFHRTTYLIMALLIVITMPFSLKLCSWSIALFTLNWLAEGKLSEKLLKIRNSVFLQIGLLLALVHITSLAYTDNWNHGLKVLETKSAFFVLPLVLGTMPAFSKEEVKRIFSGFIIACTIAIIVSLAVAIVQMGSSNALLTNFDYFNAAKYLTQFPDSSSSWHLFTYIGLSNTINIHPMYFSMYLLFAACLFLYANQSNFRTTNTFGKGYIIIIVCLLLGSVILLSSRITILSLFFLGVFFIGKHFFSNHHYYTGIFSCFLFTVFMMSAILYNPVTRFRLVEEPLTTKIQYPDNSTKWNSVNLRMLQWNASVDIIRHNLLFGVGIGDMSDVLNREYEATVDLGEFNINLNAHNQYLQTAMALGVPCLLVFMFYLVYPIRMAHRNHDLVYLTFIFIVAACFLTESLLETQKGIVFFSFFNGLLFFHHSPHVGQKINA